MATSLKSGLVKWSHNDWREKPSTADKIRTLQRHMQEVERFVFEAQDNNQKLRLQDGYLPYLQEQLERLETRNVLATSSALSRVGRTSKFVRGEDS